MPFDPTMLSSLTGQFPGAAGSMPSSGDFSTLATNWMNQRFSEKMYNRTRADNIDFWNMQNAYNSPQAQMERLKAAGLNPNLVYGNGNAVQPAGNIPTPDVLPANFREPRMDGGKPDLLASLMGIADLRIKQAQADNLQVQNDNLIQDGLIKRLTASRLGFDLSFDSEMRSTNADYKRESLRQLSTSIDLSINRDAREAAANSASIAEAFQRTLNLMEQRKAMPIERERLRENIRLMKQQGVINKLEIELRQLGLTPNSPWYAQIVGRAITNAIKSPIDFKGIGDSIIDWLIPKSDPTYSPDVLKEYGKY